MKRSIGAAVLACLAGSSLSAAAQCPVAEGEDAMSRKALPAVSAAQMSSGRPGYVAGTWRTPQLLLAWRVLSGVPTGAGLVAAIDEVGNCREANQAEASLNEAVSQWQGARRDAVGPMAGGIEHPRDAWFQGFSGLPHGAINCAADAFRRAAATLRSRTRQLGAGSAAVKGWVLAQDSVFSNCAKPGRIPDEPPQAATDVVSEDLRYQRAAALMYAQRHEEAARAFERIAARLSSPWRQWSVYLQARALLRSDNGSNGPALERASQILEMLRGPAVDAEVAHAAMSLLHRTRARHEPRQVLAEISEQLAGGTLPQADLAQAVRDFTWLIARFGPRADHEAVQWISAMRGKRSPQAPGGQFFAYSGSEPEAADQASAADRWRSTRNPAWLLAALTHLRADDAQVQPLLRAAAVLDGGHPAWATVTVHRVRLLFDLGRIREGRRVATLLLRRAHDLLPGSDVNHLRRLVLPHARSLDDWVEASHRVVHASYLPLQPHRLLVDADVLADMNERMPVAMLARLAGREDFAYAKQAAAMAWSRSLALAMLGEDPAAWARVGAYAALLPRHYPGLEPDLRQLRAARSVDERRAIASALTLTHPGLVGAIGAQVMHLPPDDELARGNMHPWYSGEGTRENWWCRLGLAPETAGTADELQHDKVARSPSRPAQPLALLAASERQAWSDESARLAGVGDATTALGFFAVRHALVAPPNDLMVAKALRQFVRSARGGCVGAHAQALSRTALALLRWRYAETPWARQVHSHYARPGASLPVRQWEICLARQVLRGGSTDVRRCDSRGLFDVMRRRASDAPPARWPPGPAG